MVASASLLTHLYDFFLNADSVRVVWRVDWWVTSWPCDELTMWRVDWATTDMGRKLGRRAVSLWGGAGSPSNTMWADAYLGTSMPSCILILPTVWSQYINITDSTDRQDRQTVHTNVRFANHFKVVSWKILSWFRLISVVFGCFRLFSVVFVSFRYLPQADTAIVSATQINTYISKIQNVIKWTWLEPHPVSDQWLSWSAAGCHQYLVADAAGPLLLPPAFHHCRQRHLAYHSCCQSYAGTWDQSYRAAADRRTANPPSSISLAITNYAVPASYDGILQYLRIFLPLTTQWGPNANM